MKENQDRFIRRNPTKNSFDICDALLVEMNENDLVRLSNKCRVATGQIDEVTTTGTPSWWSIAMNKFSMDAKKKVDKRNKSYGTPCVPPKNNVREALKKLLILSFSKILTSEI